MKVLFWGYNDYSSTLWTEFADDSDQFLWDSAAGVMFTPSNHTGVIPPREVVEEFLYSKEI